MSTLRISNIEAKSVPASATIDEKVKITNSSGDPLVFIDGKTSGITTVGINTTDPNITFDANSNVVVTGIITATKFSGEFETTSVGIADSIFHTGDTNTSINFPAADTITAETGGSERLRIDSSGRVLIGTTTEGYVSADDLTVATTGSTGITIRSGTSSLGTIAYSDGTSGDAEYRGYLQYAHDVDALKIGTAGSERLRIDSSGRLLIGTTSNRVTRLATNTFSPKMQLESDGEAAFSMSRFINAAGPPRLVLQKARGTGASPVVVQNNDHLGQILFSGWDGDTLTNGAEIIAEVDGTPSDDVMPGRLKFKTNAGGTTNTVRLEIDSNGNKIVQNGRLNILSTFIDFSGDVSTPSTAAAIYRPADNTLAFSTANTERVRILSSGGMTFNGDTAAANALDDYEEGSWTPTFVGGSGSITVNSYNVQYGKYVKIGKIVYVEGLLRANVTNNSNGTYDLGGLPFTVANTPNASGILHGKEQSSWTTAPDHFSCISNNTIARARRGLYNGASAYTNANTVDFNSGSATNNRIYFAGCYRVEG